MPLVRLMSVTIKLPAAIVDRATQEARRRGLPMAAWAAEVVEVALADLHIGADQQPADALQRRPS